MPSLSSSCTVPARRGHMPSQPSISPTVDTRARSNSPAICSAHCSRAT
ncbi:hypothetical protein ACFPRL_26775 [Pseudoclavibacter helvolus]